MRTTLDIDEDILAAAKELARAEGKTAGKVLSELARRALTTPSFARLGLAEGPAAYDAADDLFPRFPKVGGALVTLELVRRIQDEIDEEDARSASCETGGKNPE